MRMIRLLALSLAAVSVMKAQAPAPAPAPVVVESQQEITAQIDRLQRELAELRRTYNDNHPDVRAMRSQLSAQQARLRTLDERNRAETAARARTAAEAARATKAAAEATKAQAKAAAAATKAQAKAVQVQSQVKALPQVAPRAVVVEPQRFNLATGPTYTTSTLGQLFTRNTADANLPRQWWRDANTARTVGIDDAQKQRMDEIFQQYRLKLVDLNANLEKAELTLEPLMDAERIDEGRISTQIDRVADARAELEKARSRMMLDLRMELTPEQWRKLNNR